MSVILRKIGPCNCLGICTGNCSQDILKSKKIDINEYITHIYCINLPNSKERRNAMTIIFDEMKIYPTFLRAISPMDRSFHKLKKSGNVDTGWSPRCFCLDNNGSLCNRHVARQLREVEIAISMSHLHVYEKIIKNNDIMALVCEDDIILMPNTMEILSEILNPLLPDLRSDKPIIVFAGGAKNNPNLKISDPSNFTIKPSNGVYSNYAYILNKAAAIILKKYAYPISKPDDSYKRYLIGKKKITAYQIIPSIVAELSSGINARPIYNRLSKETSLNALEKSISTEIRHQKSKKKIDKEKNDYKSI